MPDIYILNAFAKTKGGGNPAGVVLDAEYLSETEMLKIAKQVGFSETAFLMKSNKADFRVRFFTPAAEVDLCGHATIATFSLLFRKGIIEAGFYTQETKAGVLKISAQADGSIYMQQNIPSFGKIISKLQISESLQVSEDIICKNLPVQIVSTGLSDLIVPINSWQNLQKIKPDFARVKKLSRQYSVVGYHLFCLETLQSNSAHCRNLAPLFDINEEAATGTASGALACYMFKHGLINKKQAENLVFEQGYTMKRPSEILASLKIVNNEIREVWVGGSAEFVGKKKIDNLD